MSEPPHRKSFDDDGGGDGGMIPVGESSITTPSCPFHPQQHRKERRSIQIRLTNATSNRSKDLIVDINTSNSLFESVYENKSVKEAHIRKWDKQHVEKVKSKQSEIQCAVWNEQVNKPAHWFTIEEMKTTSTKQLYEMLPPTIDAIPLVLQCVPYGTKQRDTVPIVIEEKDGDEIEPIPNIGIGDDNNIQGTSSSSTSNSVVARTTGCPFSSGALIDPNSFQKLSKTMKCPFSGIDIDSSVMEEFKARMKAKTTTVDRASAVMDDFMATKQKPSSSPAKKSHP